MANDSPTHKGTVTHTLQGSVFLEWAYWPILFTVLLLPASWKHTARLGNEHELIVCSAGGQRVFVCCQCEIVSIGTNSSIKICSFSKLFISGNFHLTQRGQNWTSYASWTLTPRNSTHFLSKCLPRWRHGACRAIDQPATTSFPVCLCRGLGYYEHLLDLTLHTALCVWHHNQFYWLYGLLGLCIEMDTTVLWANGQHSNMPKINMQSGNPVQLWLPEASLWLIMKCFPGQ